MADRRGLLSPIDVQGLLAARSRGLLGSMPTGEMRAHVPGLRDRIGNMVFDAATAMGLRQSAQRMRQDAGVAMDFIPGLGDAVGANEAGRDLAAGNYGRAAVGGAATALGTVPGLGDLAGGAIKAIFAGVGAKTADKFLLEQAQGMAERGVDKAKIWADTGWFKGTDGKWRFEIDDSTSQFQGINPEPQSTPIRAAVKHKELFDAYPDMIPITAHETSMARGEHGALLGDPGEEMINVSWSARDKHSTLLHELQHGVQNREGFGAGGNAISAFGHSDPKVRKAVAEEMEKLLRTLPREEYARELRKSWPEATDADVAESYKGYLKANKEARSSVYHPVNKAAQETASMNVYRRMAGEVESRNVQSRMNMTADQRRATPPWLTQDTPDEQQIVRRR